MTSVPDGLKLTPFDKTFFNDPYAVYKDLRQLDPVHKDVVSFYEASWTISDYDSVKKLLVDGRLSVNPESVSLRRDPRADNPVTLRQPDMMNLDEPDHQRLRSLVHKAFTPSSISQFGVHIERIVERCLSDITEPSFDVVTSISKPVPTIVIAEYIGVDGERHEDFKRWTDSLLLQGYPQPTESQWREIVSADASLRNHIATVISERRSAPGGDLVSRLIAAHDEEDKLTANEVIDMCYLLIGAGNFTTTDLISNSLYAMLKYGPFDDPGLVVEETLRFDPPAMGVRRYVTEDIEIGGKTIERGSVVNLLTGSANHDPAYYVDPDRFIPTRDSGAHLAFGRGIHHCLGAPLARLEAEIAVRMFNERFPAAQIKSSKRSKRMDFRGFTSLVVSV